MRKFIFSIVSISSFSLMALPIDWHGSFGVDSTIVGTYSKLDNKSQSVTPIPDGSQEVGLIDDATTASFQTYSFRLAPTIIINDSSTIFAELTTGYGYGGRLGDNTTHDFSGNFDVPLQYLTTSAGLPLNVSQLYMELYSDSAIWQIGRYSADWALGAIVNSGKNPWDRYTFIRDGITANLKFSNFKFSPYWAIVSANSLTRADKITEQGISVLYDSSERDFSIGLLYGTRSSGDQPSTEQGIDGGTLDNIDIKILDLYLSKKISNFSFALELPLFSGNLGKAFSPTQDSNYNAKAFIVESKYEISNQWELSTKLGTISGEEGNAGSFNALYLNPNYQVGKLIGRYNFLAFADQTTYNLHDSFMTNMRYLGVYGKMKSDKYTFTSGLIYAVANEVASSGNSSFNHLKGKQFTSAADQANDLGIEVDLGMNYQWNKEISLGIDFAYHFVGDYYTFSNDDANDLNAANSLYFGLGAHVTF